MRSDAAIIGRSEFARKEPPTPVESARHICEEARVVLSYLRGGPPEIARGELAQNLCHLRRLVKARFLDPPDHDDSNITNHISSACPNNSPGRDIQERLRSPSRRSAVNSASETSSDKTTKDSENRCDKDTITGDSGTPPATVTVPGSKDDPTVAKKPSPNPESSGEHIRGSNSYDESCGEYDYHLGDDDVGPYARPFLAVVMDPLAAGPHTLVAVRALHRLLERNTLISKRYERNNGECLEKVNYQMHEHGLPRHEHTVALEPLMRGILKCKFEQTDAGADEAVEMAIADLFSLIASLDANADAIAIEDNCPEVLNEAQGEEYLRVGRIRPETRMDAFQTVFVNRNTYVHSPALCYHFDTVLTEMVSAAFSFNIRGLLNKRKCLDEKGGRKLASLYAEQEYSARPIFEFLVQQLLHTPLLHTSTDSSGGGRVFVNEVNEAQAAHDATRVLCLKLTRCALRTGWGGYGSSDIQSLNLKTHLKNSPSSRSLLEIIQDDLCLALLMTGQAMGSTLSLEVLSEVCATITTCWRIKQLRCALSFQLEAIFNGIFQRALVLLRQRAVPNDSGMFMSNLAFDAECEIILETLVDILCFHEEEYGGMDGVMDGVMSKSIGALEELYATYDCNLNTSDVTSGLILELSKCCDCSGKDDAHEGTPVLSSNGDRSARSFNPRQVPAHLKELCAEALVGSLKTLFKHVNDMQRSASFELSNSKGELCSLRKNKQQKKLLRIAATKFNKKSTEGITFLSSSKEGGVFTAPMTPLDVAIFLKQGLVFGLDKTAIGVYLGETGKGPKAGKNPHECERDWFHQKTLSEYCKLFHFESQSLLDGLRMFLSSFRLPGEAQMIDRILQAFAESCGRQCNEASRLNLFSEDDKKASDAAYLLAFSIIMLNTDLHNENIRADRKMTMDAFVRNNSNYGRDITDEGKELPREFLESIYESIKEEEIRTEAEGAGGVMTVERWKDLLRSHRHSSNMEGKNEHSPKSILLESNSNGGIYQGEDEMEGHVLKDLVLENIWEPILGSIRGFWGVIEVNNELAFLENTSGEESGNVMLGSEGARLGMDLAIELLAGVRFMERKDIFQNIFQRICHFSGLLQYDQGPEARMISFVYSVQRQSAVIVAMNTAKEAGDFIGKMGWNCIWGVVFELRDLQLLGVKGGGLMIESDPDLLPKNTRVDLTVNMMKEGLNNGTHVSGKGSGARKTHGMFGAMGKLFFGEGDESRSKEGTHVEQSIDGKEEFLIWNEFAPSDDEDDDTVNSSSCTDDDEDVLNSNNAGAAFESQLIHEDHLVFINTPPSSKPTISQRCRVRRRLASMCDFRALVAESRFLTLGGIQDLLSSLIEIVRASNKTSTKPAGRDGRSEEKVGERMQFSNSDSSYFGAISPASEAFAEVLICEITLKNRDRIGMIWESLERHYNERLACDTEESSETDEASGKQDSKLVSPGIEKCVTGLIRLSCWMVNREGINNQVLGSIKLLHPPHGLSSCFGLEMHLSEGLWRICQYVDGLKMLNDEGWGGLLGLVEFCASRGGAVVRAGPGRGGLAEDDPALHAFRALHLILHSPELKNSVPCSVVQSIRALIVVGERGRCAKLCIAGLDLLLIMHSRLGKPVTIASGEIISTDENGLWVSVWPSVLEGMAEASKKSIFGGVRQHALSMLTDAIIDRHGGAIPTEQLFAVVHNSCISVAGIRISALLKSDNIEGQWEEVMIELKLCISLVFKPFLHHLKILIQIEDKFATLWESMLNVMEQLLGDETSVTDFQDSPKQKVSAHMNRDMLLMTTKELGSEHLRNAVMVLMTYGVLESEASPSSKSSDLSALTWTTIGSMGYCRNSIAEWKQSGHNVRGNNKGDIDSSKEEKGRHTLSDTSNEDASVVDNLASDVPEVRENACEEVKS